MPLPWWHDLFHRVAGSGDRQPYYGRVLHHLRFIDAGMKQSGGEEWRTKLVRYVLLKCLGQPVDVAAAVERHLANSRFRPKDDFDLRYISSSGESSKAQAQFIAPFEEFTQYHGFTRGIWYLSCQ